MATFTPEFLDELRARTGLADLIGRKVALKKKGNEWAGCCPFHNEKTPSFYVNERKGFFHCFGCGAHGDAIGFVMKNEGLPFPDTVEKLARDAGLALPVASPQERERAKVANTLQSVVEMAAAWFEKQLRMPGGKAGHDYLRGRGLGEDVIARFRLGWAPDNREALKAAMKREGVEESLLVEAGLLIRPEDGGRESYDRFRGRVMFPIMDRRGRVIAFGGRIIGPGEPKYLNSPETPLFHKGHNLYCLHLAREAAHRGAPAIVAEGYMDAIALQSAGFAGAVAPLGTAMTEDQIALLWRMCDEPILCFDGDNAGKRAAGRAAERATPHLKPGKSLRFVSLPPGEDPDSLIRARGPQAMQGAIERARPLAEILYELETVGADSSTPERRAMIERALMQRVEAIADPSVREQYRRDFRDRLWRAGRPARGPGGMRPRSATGWRGGRDQPVSPFAAGSALAATAHDLEPVRRERLLVGAFAARPEWLDLMGEDLAALHLADRRLDELRAALLAYAAHAGELWGGEAAADPFDAAAVAAHLAEAGVADVAAAVAGEAETAIFREAASAPARAGEETFAEADDRPSPVVRWRHIARLHADAAADDLGAAAPAAGEELTEESWERLQRAIEEKLARRHEAV